MLIAVFLRSRHVPCDMPLRLFHRSSCMVKDPDTVRPDLRDLSVLQIDHIFGVTDQGGDVGSEEILSGTETDDERTCLPCGVEHPGKVPAHDPHRVGAFQPGQRFEHGVLKVPVVVFHQELDDDFCVGLAEELHALLDELPPDLCIVFNDAVVDDGEESVHRHVRMGVDVAGSPMCGPSGVPDAAYAVHLLIPAVAFDQRVHLSAGLEHTDARIALNGYAGGIVAPVFQSFQTAQQDRGCLRRACESDYPAHGVSPLLNESSTQIFVLNSAIASFTPAMTFYTVPSAKGLSSPAYSSSSK